MKKTLTILVAALMATTATLAQQHAPMAFAGASKMKVMTTEIDNPSDTILFSMKSMTAGDITLPAMKGMSTIPSFTIENITFQMGADHVVTFPDQTFTATADADGTPKTVTGESISGTYSMADNSLTITAVFKYGTMPLSMTYSIKGYYVKTVTNSIKVVVGGQFTYGNESVTYKVRKYTDGDTQKLDVEVPTYSLAATVMGDLTLGSYTIKGLTYDSGKEAYFRDYAGDGLSFHFKAEMNGTATMDGDYQFNPEKENTILVKYNGNNVESIINTFQMGAMPFGIVSTLGSKTTGISNLTTGNRTTDNRTYDLSGRQSAPGTKGIIITDGRLMLNR